MDDTIEQLLRISSGGFPINTVFIRDDGSGDPSVIAFLPDVEGDVVALRFSNESAVEIVTEEYSYISLSQSMLHNLDDMIDEADELWKALDAYWDEKESSWFGWEHLAIKPDKTE